MKIALIMPIGRDDTLFDDLIDGLQHVTDVSVEFYVSSGASLIPGIERYVLNRDDFLAYAQSADLILLSYGKKGTDYSLAQDISRWDNTVFIDGSEPGKNNRLDPLIQKKILDLQYREYGGIDTEMLQKCALYFRREKPYINGIQPLPFGINSRYIGYQAGIVKDIDFVCIFGQDQYPPLRRQTQEVLAEFCKKNNFSCVTQKTKNPEEFYQLLARAKVGVSVSGGGYDTLRFWEILANNCLLLTERIDIYKLGSGALQYDRIWQFNNLYDFHDQLVAIGNFLQKDYNQEVSMGEYNNILSQHSSSARIITVIDAARDRGLL